MTTANPASDRLEAAGDRDSFLGGLGRALAAAGDSLNPILVKETRQALKSRQFITTFALLLSAGWLYSFFGIAMIGPAVSFTARGPELFVAYFAILAFPLLVIVPFSALRSLAVEREDGTYELMSITTLRPRQIVAGKLGSAGVQTAIYLSAILPFLAFTYLLRGIDVFTIFFAIAWLVLLSLGLSALGLLLATGSRERHWQSALSVVFIAGLLWIFGMSVALASELATSPLPFRDVEFWQINLALFTAYASVVALAFLTAAAQLTFSHDNRSTAIRVAVWVQQALLAGWMIYFAAQDDAGWEYLIFWVIAAALHAYATGIFFTAESPILSPRVRRSLPKAFVGRLLTTWFNPGPATGFWFTVANLAASIGMACATYFALRIYLPANSAWSSAQSTTLLQVALLTMSYVVVFLGLGAWIVRMLRRFAPVAPALPILIQVLIVLALAGMPLVIHYSSVYFRIRDYSPLLIFNPAWTIYEVVRNRGVPGEAGVWILLVPLSAIVILALNLPGAALELLQGRLAAPPRVIEEDAEREAKSAAPPARTSPWDD